VLSGASPDDPDHLEYPPRVDDADVQALIVAAARALAREDAAELTGPGRPPGSIDLCVFLIDN
jgi:hypothetical protein